MSDITTQKQFQKVQKMKYKQLEVALECCVRNEYHLQYEIFSTLYISHGKLLQKSFHLLKKKFQFG